MEIEKDPRPEDLAIADMRSTADLAIAGLKAMDMTDDPEEIERIRRIASIGLSAKPKEDNK